MLIVAFARPEVHHLFPRLWTERPLEEIRLSRLTRTASERLVREVLREAATPALVARVLEQADGVPFCLEALARSAARGGEQIPESVLAMTQSRFEELDPQARRVLRAASIFGRTFWRGGVFALVGGVEGPGTAREQDHEKFDGALRELCEEKLIVKRQESRLPDEQEYDFCSTLICESAYAMLTQADARPRPPAGSRVARARKHGTDGGDLTAPAARQEWPARADRTRCSPLSGSPKGSS